MNAVGHALVALCLIDYPLVCFRFRETTLTSQPSAPLPSISYEYPQAAGIIDKFRGFWRATSVNVRSCRARSCTSDSPRTYGVREVLSTKGDILTSSLAILMLVLLYLQDTALHQRIQNLSENGVHDVHLPARLLASFS